MASRLGTGILAEPNFRRLFLGQTLSTLGDAAATIAVAFGVLALEGSATALGVVLAARYVPLASFLLIGGVVADRVPRRRLVLAADAVRAIAQATLAALLLSGSATLWQIVVLQAVYGSAEAFFGPALTGFIPQLVAADRLQQANALIRMTFDLSIIAGPALGGILVVATGPGGAVAADAATFALSALLLARVEPVHTARARPPSERLRVLAEMRVGWSEVRSRSWLWVSIANFTIFTALAMPGILVLGPELARTELGGVATWSLLTTAFGAGSLVGSLASLRLRLPRPAVAVAVLLALGAARPLVLVSGLGLPLIAVGCFAAGAAMSMAGILWVAMLQQNIPGEALSRVDSIDAFGTFLLSPLGYAVAGPLAAAVGLHLGMLLLAAVPLLVSLATVGCVQIRRLAWRDSPRREPENADIADHLVDVVV